MNKTDKIIAQARKEGRKSLLEPEAKMICIEYGITVPEFDVAKNEDQAAEIAEQIGFPVVLKVVSPDIIHKSEAGGVKVGLKNGNEVRAAYQAILKGARKYNIKANVVGVLVQEMAPQSTEVIIGAVKDAQFGQTLMFGLGGIFVELLKDVSFRIAPISEEDAVDMIAGIKAYPLLKGYRNMPPVDIEAIIKLLLCTSKLVMEHPEIKEIDLNPVLVYKKGSKTVDARVILE